MSELAVQRLFLALWPTGEVRLALDRLLRKHLSKSGRRVPVENLHITLVFLGAAAPQARECVEAAAMRVCASGFTLELDRVGWWPRPKVVWAGASRIPQALSVLVTELHRGCRDCGFALDARPFRAHATLARKVRAWGPAVDIDPIHWPVSTFSLVESKTLPSGAQYQVLRSWPLA